MGNKGIGINECPKHGEYYADAPDSPAPPAKILLLGLINIASIATSVENFLMKEKDRTPTPLMAMMAATYALTA